MLFAFEMDLECLFCKAKIDWLLVSCGAWAERRAQFSSDWDVLHAGRIQLPVVSPGCARQLSVKYDLSWTNVFACILKVWFLVKYSKHNIQLFFQMQWLSVSLNMDK